MSHLYPLARSAEDALVTTGASARTQAEATTLAGELVVHGLETGWLTIAPEDRARQEERAETGISEGYVQRYENAEGALVLAVTYWKLVDTEPVTAPIPPKPTREDDHTDDLYFKAGRTKKRARKRKVDPNQMDLFTVSENDKS